MSLDPCRSSSNIEPLFQEVTRPTFGIELFQPGIRTRFRIEPISPPEREYSIPVFQVNQEEREKTRQAYDRLSLDQVINQVEKVRDQIPDSPNLVERTLNTSAYYYRLGYLVLRLEDEIRKLESQRGADPNLIRELEEELKIYSKQRQEIQRYVECVSQPRNNADKTVGIRYRFETVQDGQVGPYFVLPNNFEEGLREIGQTIQLNIQFQKRIYELKEWKLEDGSILFKEMIESRTRGGMTPLLYLTARLQRLDLDKSVCIDPETPVSRWGLESITLSGYESKDWGFSLNMPFRSRYVASRIRERAKKIQVSKAMSLSLESPNGKISEYVLQDIHRENQDFVYTSGLGTWTSEKIKLAGQTTEQSLNVAGLPQRIEIQEKIRECQGECNVYYGSGPVIILDSVDVNHLDEYIVRVKISGYEYELRYYDTTLDESRPQTDYLIHFRSRPGTEEVVFRIGENQYNQCRRSGIQNIELEFVYVGFVILNKDQIEGNLKIPRWKPGKGDPLSY